MKLSKIFALLCALPLVACGKPSFNTTETQQRLFAVVSDYQTVQEAALSYKKLCDSGKLINHDCKTYVLKIADYNKKANGLIQSVGGNFADTSYNAGIAQSLLILTSQLSTYLVEAQQKELTQ